jgi:3-oxoacyl-[acyl-carrier protein] reductase
LQDNVALVTGGASGIGRAVSILIAKEGADVVVADINPDGARETVALVEAEGRQGLAVRADVSDTQQVRNMVDAAVAAFGRIDILINNAGILEQVSALDMTESQWRRSLSVMLDGVFFVAQAVGRHMVESGNGGSIVNTGSLCSLIAIEGSASYCAAKAGVLMLSKVLALEWARHDIRVNCVLPGYVATPLIADADPGARASWLSEVPMGRFAGPEEIAEMMVMLASDHASYVTGASLLVDGGRMVR